MFIPDNSKFSSSCSYSSLEKYSSVPLSEISLSSDQHMNFLMNEKFLPVEDILQLWHSHLLHRNSLWFKKKTKQTTAV
jgi:hypothetical protein